MAGTVQTQTYLETQIARACLASNIGDQQLFMDLVATMFDPSTEVNYTDDVPLSFGASEDAQLLWSTGDASNETLVLSLGDTNQSLHITDLGAAATDWNVSAETHPTIYVHSNTTPATDYLLIGRHDGSLSWIDMVGGATLKLGFDGLEALILAETASAVNEVTITNAITATAPSVAATGDDTNISLGLVAKGSGYVIAKVGRFCQKFTAAAVTNTATITAANVRAGIIDGTPTASSTYTFPTAQQLRQEIVGAEVGTSLRVIVNNKAATAKTITIAAGANGTLDGTATVAQNVIREYIITFTNVTSGSETYRLDGMA